jgi:putative hydrolase of the HAD superfamily
VIKAVISDFGGVITNPLIEGFTRAHAELGIPVEALGTAMRLAAERHPEPPLWTLERGQITEPQFIGELEGILTEVTGEPVRLDGYGRRLMQALDANTPLLDYLRRLRDERAIRLAVLTNNVREWQPIWRERFMIDELFELVVDSGFEGTRKPEPEIYARTLSRLGLDAQACAFLDDVEVNVTAARALGLHAIHFRDTAQATAELDALVAAA